MQDILLVYKQVELQFDENGEIIVPDDYKLTITVSYDEKPGIQAIANTSDRPAVSLRRCRTGGLNLYLRQNMGHGWIW